ncbi:MAG: type I restriction endonuclease [Paludibacteraceae bacterium]|nr:type I restriction endonuclease [Paludibacteraceae bacterium]
MELKDSLKQLAERASTLKNNLLTEEATKNALIMPFIQALGYDVFNPLEVVPELDCDINKKKGEKIDYAILKEGEPIIVIECKHWQQPLDLHKAQLSRYFVASKAKFGLLTNGIEYRFYTDLVKTNIMDESPFLSLNIENLRETQIDELKKFMKENFDIETIMSSANELKYMLELKNCIKDLVENPNPDFVKSLAKNVYSGKFTESVLAQFTEMVKKASASYIHDRIAERLNIVVKSAEEDQKANDDKKIDVPGNKKEAEVVTTQSEIEAYYTIKAILRSIVQGKRVVMRDALSYCAILLDDNNRKPICKLHFNNEANLRVELFDSEGNSEKVHIESIDELYNYANQLIESTKRFL